MPVGVGGACTVGKFRPAAVAVAVAGVAVGGERLRCAVAVGGGGGCTRRVAVAIVANGVAKVLHRGCWRGGHAVQRVFRPHRDANLCAGIRQR